MDRNRIELHIHLDGAIKYETIHEIFIKKSMLLPGNGSLEHLKKALIITEPKDLAHFLAPFGIFTPMLQDLEVAERIAFEFCEEAAKNNILYAEARYSPHNFLPLNQSESSHMTALEEVIKAITRGFTTGEAEFGIKARSILCTLNGTGSAEDVLKLCQKFKGEGVVGIDMATGQCLGYNPEEVALDQNLIDIYEEARRCGIHRTLHAGESGGPTMVSRALDLYHSERIGHGYHVIEDDALFKKCVSQQVHLECCPRSSLLTGSVKLAENEIHPIVRFAENGVNFSINSDDPTITGHWVEEDYKLLESWGLNETHFRKANLNAAEACFLPEQEKKELINSMKKLWK